MSWSARLANNERSNREDALLSLSFIPSGPWPDAESFQRFFEGASDQIQPLMAEAGVTEEPKPTIWRKLETQDEYGWEGQGSISPSSERGLAWPDPGEADQPRAENHDP